MKILALDPGTYETGWVLVDAGDKIEKIILHGKTENPILLDKFRTLYGNTDLLNGCVIAVEKMASYGMPVGEEVFEAAEWTGRFEQELDRLLRWPTIIPVYRREEKTHLCHTQKANDAAIRRALADKYGLGFGNYGKGTKAHPSILYGLKADEWSALAVADTVLAKMGEKK